MLVGTEMEKLLGRHRVTNAAKLRREPAVEVGCAAPRRLEIVGGERGHDERDRRHRDADE